MCLCACDGKAYMRGHVYTFNDNYEKSATGSRVYYGVH